MSKYRSNTQQLSKEIEEKFAVSKVDSILIAAYVLSKQAEAATNAIAEVNDTIGALSTEKYLSDSGLTPKPNL